MKKLVLAAIAMLLIAVPMFAATETGSDQVQISLTITANTFITTYLHDTVALTAGLTGSNNYTYAGSIELRSDVGATWYFVIESLQASPNKGLLVSGSNTLYYWLYFYQGYIDLTTDPQVYTITAPQNGRYSFSIYIGYGATNTLAPGTYTDTIKITFYDSDPT